MRAKPPIHQPVIALAFAILETPVLPLATLSTRASKDRVGPDIESTPENPRSIRTGEPAVPTNCASAASISIGCVTAVLAVQDDVEPPPN